jgi:signal transduction histidine kinase/DNA-binding response OmpR family regulator
MKASGIKFSLAVGFALVLVLLLGITLLGLNQMAAINSRLVSIVTVNNYKTELATIMRDALRDRTITMHSLVLNTAPFDQNDELYDFHNYGVRFSQALFAMELTHLSAREKAILIAVRKSATVAQPVVNRTVDLALDNRNADALKLLQTEAIPAQKLISVELRVLLKLQREANADAAVDAFDAYRETRSLMIGMGGFAVAIGMLIAFIAIRRAARQTSELEKQKLKYQTLFETNSDAIVIIGEHGFTDCNPAALRMFRIGSVAEFIVYEPHRLGAPLQADGRSAKAFSNDCVTRARNLGFCFFEWVGMRADGSYFPTEIALHAMTLDGVRVVQAIMRDITERKHIELELKTAHAAALETARVKAEFVANVSHEIRTPMNGVIGMANLILKTTLSPQQREYAQAIHHSGDMLLGVINDILDFSKIEAGKLNLESIDFNLHEVLLDTAALYANRAEEQALKFDCQIALDVPEFVRGDPGRLRQILINLIDNALKFTATGTVNISLRRDANEPNQLQFTVQDTGIGFSAETQTRLFRSFSQADGSTTRNYGGTGLGLSICKQLVELMGGSIGASSQPGVGSQFWFSLPLSAAPAQDTAPVTASATNPSVFHGERVLVAEDNAVNQKVMQHLLSHLGLTVDLATNGREAVSMAKATPYALILMDCQMPEMDGFEATQLIRNELDQACPIIAMTANAMPGAREQCLAAGMNDYLSKPVQETELSVMLRRWIDDADFSVSLISPIQSSAETEQPVNVEKLRQTCQGDTALLNELLEMYCDTSTPLLQQLALALAAQDAQGARPAHELKGASAYIAAGDMQTLSAQLEQAILNHDWDEAETLFEDIEAAFIRVQLFIGYQITPNT